MKGVACRLIAATCFVLCSLAWHSVLQAGEEDVLRLEVVCPYVPEGPSRRSIHVLHTISTASRYSSANYPLQALVGLANPTAHPAEQVEVEVALGPHLSIEPPPVEKEWRQRDDRRLTWSVAQLAPHEIREITFYLARPLQATLPTGDHATRIEARLTYLQAGAAHETSLTYPIELKNPSRALGPLVMFAVCFGLLVVVIGWSRRSAFLSRFSTVELVTMGVFTAFLIAVSFLTQLLRAMGAPSIVLHGAWYFFFWIVLIVAARVLSRPGAVAVIIFASSIATGLLLYGLSVVLLITYALPASIVLEAWFLLSGYARTLRSALGAALVYLAFPTAFFWFFTAPVFYHYYYALWYVEWWLAVDAVVFIGSALVGFRMARQVALVVR